MFTTENQKCYLAEVQPKADGDKRIAYCKFHITPVSHALAVDISPLIADRIFRGSNGSYAPVLEMSSAHFLTNYGKQCMTVMRDPNYAVGRALIQDAEIKSLAAKKLFPDNPDFSIVFVVAFEIQDPLIVKDLVQLLHENVYLSFSPMQPALFETKKSTAFMDLNCRLCDAPNPEFVTLDEKFAYCAKCECNKAEGEVTRRIRDHVQAAAAAATMQEEPARAEDPLIDKDFNQRNRQSRRKK